MTSGPIQPRLPGFLDLLQLKNTGRQPTDLVDQVVSTIDVSHWYGFDRIEFVGASAAIVQNILVNGSAAFSSVPSDEVWLLWGAATRLSYNTPTITNLEVWDLAPAIQPFASVLPYRLGEPFNPFFSADATAFPASSAGINGTSVWFDRPILLPPNAYYGFMRHLLITDPANGGTVDGRFAVTKLAI